MRRGVARAVVVGTLFAGAIPVSVGPASPTHLTAAGYVHTGVPHEEAARQYNCENEEGGWEHTGPVVCVAKHADVYTVQIETDDADCHRRGDSWEGTCVFDIDMDDHVRVWGISGVPYTRFVVEFGHGTTAGNGGRPATARSTPPTTRPPGAGSPSPSTAAVPTTVPPTSTTVASPETTAADATSTTADASITTTGDGRQRGDDIAAAAGDDRDDSAMPVLVLLGTLTVVGAAAIGLSRWRAPRP